jgi:uncharacterized protein
MIDLHTHVWDVDAHLTEGFRRVIGESFRATPTGVSTDGDRVLCPPADPDRHWRACQQAEKTVVVAFDMGHAGAVVPNEYVASYVQRHPDRLIGFASVDPRRPDALELLRYAHGTLALRGVKLSSTYQGFHPHDPRAYALYGYCERHGLPILVHQGATIVREAPLALANPVLLEQVAYDFPDLVIIVAHVGFPWASDCVVLMRKQPNVFADISALCYRPWQLYDTLVKAMEGRVTDKLFFGTDWPFTTIDQTVEGLRRVCGMGLGTGFPIVPEALVNDIVQRDPLPAIGLS